MTSSTRKRLLLLRHALASWPSTGAKDYDRPLDPSGFAIIDDLAQKIAAQGLAPDAVICSSALRTRQTLEHLQKFWQKTPMIEFNDQLYSGNASDYLQAIHDFGYLNEDQHSLMLIGHNPSIEDLTFALTQNQSSMVFDRLRAGFPTAGLAVFEFDMSFDAIVPRKGELVSFPTL